MAVDPAKTYHGKPCKHCEGTQRWRASRDCVACVRDRNRVRMARQENVDRNRARTRIRREDHVTYYRELLTNRRRAALKRQEARHG